MLVDTGTVAGEAEFMDTLTSVIDPMDLRWIWLTHTDFDHLGWLAHLLDRKPELRVITSFLGTGIMGLSSTPLARDRVRSISEVVAIRPCRAALDRRRRWNRSV
jgi:flavorubredoxin